MIVFDFLCNMTVAALLFAVASFFALIGSGCVWLIWRMWQ